MLEVTIWSLLVGHLGSSAVALSGWLRTRQLVTSKQDWEEEEILTCFESKEDSVSENQPRHGAPLPPDPQLVGWEFKIVRANRDLFADPVVFKKLCDEEGTAGWILLEKFDDRRVRFKRLIALRELLDGEKLSHDPYRTYYGSSWSPFTVLLVIATFLAMVVPSYFAYTWVSAMLAKSQQQPSVSPSPSASSYEEIPAQSFPPRE
jgi:hypothetical protein